MDFDKSKVFSTINATELKIGSKGYFADTLDAMKKLIEREDKLETLMEILDENNICRFKNEKGEKNFLFYLVEEASLVPYEGESDLIDDWYKRVKKYDDLYGYTNCMVMPAIWVREKSSGAKYQITGFSEGKKSYLEKPFVVISDVLITSYDQLLKLFTFLDESPCGKIKVKKI